MNVPFINLTQFCTHNFHKRYLEILHTFCIYHIKQSVYLVFKENILIATLLKRGNKNVDIKFSAHERFWNNLMNQVAQNQKIGKPNNLIILGAQDLWILMLCRSFFTPGRDIGSAVFMVWVLVQTGMLSCDSTVNTD